MFFMVKGGWKLADARTVSRKCGNCGNTTDHFVWVQPYGPQVGLVFLKKPLLSKKQYLLACPTCSTIAEVLTKEQAEGMRS